MIPVEDGGEDCRDCVLGSQLVKQLLSTPGFVLYGKAPCQILDHDSHHFDLVVTLPRSTLDTCTSELLNRYGLRRLSEDEEVQQKGSTGRIVAASVAGTLLFGLCPILALRHKDQLLSHGLSTISSLLSSGAFVGLRNWFSPKGNDANLKPDQEGQGES